MFPGRKDCQGSDPGCPPELPATASFEEYSRHPCPAPTRRSSVGHTTRTAPAPFINPAGIALMSWEATTSLIRSDGRGARAAWWRRLARRRAALHLWSLLSIIVWRECTRNPVCVILKNNEVRFSVFRPFFVEWRSWSSSCFCNIWIILSSGVEMGRLILWGLLRMV